MSKATQKEGNLIKTEVIDIHLIPGINFKQKFLRALMPPASLWLSDRLERLLFKLASDKMPLLKHKISASTYSSSHLHILLPTISPLPLSGILHPADSDRRRHHRHGRHAGGHRARLPPPHVRHHRGSGQRRFHRHADIGRGRRYSPFTQGRACSARHCPVRPLQGLQTRGCRVL